MKPIYYELVSKHVTICTKVMGASWVKKTAVKKTPEVQEPQETWVRSLGQEDPLEEGMATHSSILAWRIPWIEEPGRLQSTGLQRVEYD